MERADVGENRVKGPETRFPRLDDEGRSFTLSASPDRENRRENRAATIGLSSQYRLGYRDSVASLSSIRNHRATISSSSSSFHRRRRFRSIMSHNRAITPLSRLRFRRKYSELAVSRELTCHVVRLVKGASEQRNSLFVALEYLPFSQGDRSLSQHGEYSAFSPPLFFSRSTESLRNGMRFRSSRSDMLFDCDVLLGNFVINIIRPCTVMMRATTHVKFFS